MTRPYNMFLTHLVEKYPDYAEVAANCSGYKILDNSLIECGSAMSLERVLDAAALIGADEIILPDVFQKGPETLEAVTKAIEHLKNVGKIGKYKLMAVAQGRNVLEWIECFRKLSAMPEITCIGIPKVCAKMHEWGRPYFEEAWKDTNKEIHLLGLWYGWEELDRYKYPEKIRGIDTCHNAWLATRDLPISGIRPDGFTMDLDTEYLGIDELEAFEEMCEVVECFK